MSIYSSEGSFGHSWDSKKDARTEFLSMVNDPDAFSSVFGKVVKFSPIDTRRSLLQVVRKLEDEDKLYEDHANYIYSFADSFEEEDEFIDFLERYGDILGVELEDIARYTVSSVDKNLVKSIISGVAEQVKLAIEEEKKMH